ncbi:MAG TPA: DNA-3-methyladenine glycosylase I [Candidatus Dormibacteraeota bacterium]|jgi:DNA-3-methyladenine glycosylase I|nr:DNA-3-methyladenine glycosylase I [Candidatus Dormibacteraeota bacterium]
MAAESGAGPTAPRCFGDGDPLYERYHDTEWGFPVPDERALFELLSLEAFQAGLSWRTILAKRDAFRRAFANFDADAVARFDPADVKRLLEDVSIVRNRAKIEATIGNARAILLLRVAGERLASMFRPRASRPPPPATWSDVPSTTPEAEALARELKGRGFRFLGPTTVYALMQACGAVDDHLAACPMRPAAERARRAAGLI